MTDIASVLLAAGRGSRYGAEPKLLAPYRGRPLVRHAAEAALAAAPRPVVAVLGAHADAVRAALAGLDLVLAENPDHAAGLATSLRIGIGALPAGCGAVVVLLGDMPRVTGGQVDRLAAAFRARPPIARGSPADGPLADGARPAAVVPVVDGRRGNPVLLNLRRLGPEIAGLAGDRGAGPLLAGRPDVLEIPGEPGSALDVDTPGALARLAAEDGRAG